MEDKSITKKSDGQHNTSPVIVTNVGNTFVHKSNIGPKILNSNQPLTIHIWDKPLVDYHAHENYYEIIILTQGSYLHTIDKEKRTMKAGDAVLIQPGQFHIHRKCAAGDSRHINLTCSIPFAKELFKVYFNSEPIFARQFVHLDSRYYQIVLDFQDIILKSAENVYSDLALKSFISTMLGLFFVPDPHSQMPEWLQDFISKLQNLSFDSSFEISDIYAMSHYSRTTLSKKFKEHMGQTLVSYINDLKLAHACNQLENTSFSVLRIATDSGFESYVHFARSFKTKYGCTPSEYRKQKH